MSTLLFIARLLWGEDPTTTDDSWVCWTEDNGTVEVCEREIFPCHYDVDASECVIIIKRVSVGTLDCNLLDPLACLPEV